MAAQPLHAVETAFINAWVEDGQYLLVVNAEVSRSMRRQKIDLVDVNYVLRTGVVVISDMLEARGLWHVRGRTVDAATLELIIAVASAQCEVELLRVIEVKRRSS